MKLSEVKPFYESSGDMKEHFFSIQDQGMIFDILRSKMYSNPILAICREYASNARDAHREVGTPNRPIEIQIPIGLEPTYRIKDFGPGISPDRMENIFIKYTASTKRHDNTQTGGFGLGCKSGFAYSDQFIVKTVHNGIKYSYSCAIDETKVGKLVLQHKTSTDEPNSTEIVIPVKPIDFNFFRQWTEQSCRHWEVKPKITGGAIQWTVFNKVIEGDNWAIINTNDYQKTAKLVIDGIEYPLELDALRKYADSKLIDSANGTFIMYFGVGELSLSASREQIYLDNPTQDKIRERLNEIHKEIKQRVEDKIQAFPNLWDANIYYRRELNAAFNNLNFLGKLQWHGHLLTQGYVELKCIAYTFTKGKYSRKYGNEPNKIIRSAKRRSLEFSEGMKLYLNDLSIKEPTPRHVKKAFETDPNLKNIVVICPSIEQSEDDLNKIIHLDEMMPLRLSSITKATGRAYTSSAQKLLVFKSDLSSNSFRQVSYDSMEQDANEKVLCLLSRNVDGFREVRLNKKVVESRAIIYLLKNYPQFSFYGVDQDISSARIEEEFGNFMKLEDFIEEKVINNKSINYVEIKLARNCYMDNRLLTVFDEIVPLIHDKRGTFFTRLLLHKKIQSLLQKDTGLLEIYELVKGEVTDTSIKTFVANNPEWYFEKNDKAYDKKYPLLGAINAYNIAQILEHIAHYVNMIDKI